MTLEFDYRTAFDRNYGLLSERDVDRVRQLRVGIGGLGGCGGNHLLALTRLGFEKFVVADPDRFELANMNRQAGASMMTVGREKAAVMAEMARAINPQVDVRCITAGITPDSMDAFFKDVDLVINAIDFFMIDLYEVFHDTARARGIYSMCGASPFGFGASITTFGPETPSFRECFGLEDGDDSVAKLRKFVSGMTSARFPQAYLPEELTEVRSPLSDNRISSVSPSLYLCTALTAAEALLVLLGRRPPILAPNVLQFDMFLRGVAVTHMRTQVTKPPRL